jgi:hypothetical protein
MTEKMTGNRGGGMEQEISIRGRSFEKGESEMRRTET